MEDSGVLSLVILRLLVVGLGFPVCALG